MPMKIIAGLTAALLSFVCAGASASYISMATDMSVAATPAGPELVVTSVNRGDEPAYGVQFEVIAGNEQFTSPIVARVAVGETITGRFPAGGAFDLPGHYPIVARTHYKDANAYPFSALTLGFYDHREPVVSGILVRADNATIPANGAGEVAFVLRNTDTVSRELEVALELPDELVAASSRQRLRLAPGGEKSAHFTVENFSALENSSYAIALVAQYEDGERHYSAAGPAIVRIGAPSAMAAGWFWVFAGAGAVILLLLAFAVRRQVKRPRP